MWETIIKIQSEFVFMFNGFGPEKIFYNEKNTMYERLHFVIALVARKHSTQLIQGRMSTQLSVHMFFLPFHPQA